MKYFFGLFDHQSVFDTSSETDIDKLENHIEALRGELCSTQSHIELLQAEVDRQDEELKRKDSELCTLTAKVNIISLINSIYKAPLGKVTKRTALCNFTNKHKF